MPRPVSRDDLLRAIEQSNLVAEPQLTEIRELLRDDCDAATAGKLIVAAGMLTHWQCSQLLAGRTAFFVDKYKVIDQLGKGGMGAVFLAEHAVMGRRVALKVLSKAKLASDAAVQRFRREVKAAAKLDHPNIIAAHDAGVIHGVHFLVMEHMPGSDLYAWHKKYEQMPISWACEFIRQAALGLEHAHRQGMVHRDIKPGNILVCWDDPAKLPAVKILDLGLARFTHEADIQDSVALSESADGGLTQVGQILGTPDYLAPEQIRKTHDVDIRADIFSLGCTLFKLLTGQTPFGGNTIVEKLQARVQPTAPPAVALRSLRPDAPAELEAIIARMLDRDPDRRYQTPAEVADALTPHSWQPGMPVAVDTVGADDTIGGYTPTIEVSASRFASDDEMDSGTRTFLGSLAAEASDLEGVAAPPPVAAPLAATPIAPVPQHPERTRSYSESSTATSRMMSLRRRRGSPVPWIVGGVGVAAALLLLVMFAVATVDDPAPVVSTTANVLDPPARQIPLSQNDEPREPAIVPRPPVVIDTPKPPPKVIVPKDDGAEVSLEYKPFLPPDWKPGQPNQADKLADTWRPGLPFPGVETPSPMPPGPPRKPPPRKSGSSPPFTFQWKTAGPPAQPPVRVLEGHHDAVTAVAISRDAKRIVSGSEDKTLRVWQLDHDAKPTVLEGHRDTVTDITFLYAPNRVASASRDRSIRIWDVIRGERVATLNGHTQPVTGLAALGTNPLLSFGADGLRAWNVTSAAGGQRYNGPSNEIVGIGYTTSGPRALFREPSGLLRCFQPVTEQEKYRVAGMPQPSCAAFSVEGRHLAIGSANGWLYVIDINNSRVPPAQYPAHSGGVTDVTFSPSKQIISCGADGTIRVQDIDGASPQLFRGHKGSVHSVDVSANGKLIVSGGEDQTVRVWELK